MISTAAPTLKETVDAERVLEIQVALQGYQLSPGQNQPDNYHNQYIPDSPPHGLQERAELDACDDRRRSTDDKLEVTGREEFVGHELDREQNGLGSPFACFASRVMGSSTIMGARRNAQYVGTMSQTVVSGHMEEMAPLVIHALPSLRTTVS